MILKIEEQTKTIYLYDFELNSDELIDIANKFKEYTFKYEHLSSINIPSVWTTFPISNPYPFEITYSTSTTNQENE